MENDPRSLILASGSRYRQELLQRIKPDFECISPDIDERRQNTENPRELAERLAMQKALALSADHAEAVIIGSDQVAALGNTSLGKPGGPEKAAAQLGQCSGKSVTFFTAVAIICPASGFSETHIDVTTVHFRHLSDTEISRYLEREKPWDCAGSFKSEGLGVVLFESIENQDPSALIGLPLIWVATSLQRAGIEIL